MAIWKSRAGKKPPKEWLADVIEYLFRAHGVRPTKELVDALYPILVEQWQEGATYREAGKATCACDKGKIVPSPGVRVRLEKGEVKPPRGAQRGDTFGADELRRKGEPPVKAEPKKRTPKAKPAPATPATTPAVPQSPAPLPAGQDAAMLGALKSALGGVATQITEQIVKGGSK